jgi:Ni/Fe-hydrogenase 1 B-type cytochrome subunit
MAKHTTRAEHPISTVITHWIHIVALLTLIVTGFWIHDPFTGWSFGTVRYVHLFAAFFLVGTGIFRVYWGFFGTGSPDVGSTKKVKDWHFFFPQKENRGTFWPMVAYYLFLRKTHPCTAKYNPLQKLAYGALLFAIILDAFTGLAMWHVTQPFFQPITYALGGTQMIRELHYLAMWLFIVITAVHVYIVAIEAPWELPLMFFWKEGQPVRMECVDVRDRRRLEAKSAKSARAAKDAAPTAGEGG